MQIRCPLCHRETAVPDDFAFRPFCSRRCKLADLGNWLDEAYTISTPLFPPDRPYSPDDPDDADDPDGRGGGVGVH